MNMRRVKHMLLRLSPEEKLAAGGAIAVILSSFMPWYSVVNKVSEQNLTLNAFSGDIGVMGFVVFLLTGINLAVLLGEHLHIKIPTFGYKKEKVSLFLSAESAFLMMLMLGIYTKRSLDFTNADIRFGLYTALAGAVITTFALFAQTQKKEKRSAQEFFGMEEEVAIDETTEVENSEVSEAGHGGYFYDKQVPSQPEMVSEHTAEEMFEVKQEPVAEQPIEEVAEVATEEVEEPVSNSQSDYFKRDAGIKVENIQPVEEAAAETEDEPKKAPANTGSDFYEDM